MKSVTIKIETRNSAFMGNPGQEVARILRKLADRFERQAPNDIALPYDTNGNTVGAVVVK